MLLMMTKVENIHNSIIDADDVEEVRDDERFTVGEACLNLLRHPVQMLTRWNWKAALVGAVIRSFFYLTVYQASQEKWLVTLTAVLLELAFRFFSTGVIGSITQSFRNAQPQWAAMVFASTVLPVIGQIVEFITHWGQETYFNNVFAASENSSRQRAFAISMLISILSSLFNLFAMRDGVLLVGAGEESKTLREDAKLIPALLLEFITYLPLRIIDFLKSKKFAAAFGIFLGFGLIVGAVLGAFRGKWTWAWRTALGSWAIMLIGTIIVAVGTNIYQRRAARNDS